ncbi:hypothetical protein M404DRAFT_996664 [Pisolithus tinctorius Marx 270]|uniref:Uncharacterized protein n=1 Tax=Pisolithus tinctorius Marx 270 TaxID=870435 RepID=A0A0C3KJN4_PISTI|nr:hypothetical protein M404DRAFT_996664 [Pisolithus tinctorius Marx 270]
MPRLIELGCCHMGSNRWHFLPITCKFSLSHWYSIRPLKSRGGLLHYQIIERPLHARSLLRVHIPLQARAPKLPKRHGHPRRVRFYPHRGFDLRHTYVYYMHHAENASITNFLVAAVWILDTLHVLFMCHYLYYYLITNYGVPMSLEHIVWSFPLCIVLQSLVIVAVQFFFAHQIYRICQPQVRWLMTAPIVILVLAHFVTVVVTLVDNETSSVGQARFYTATPAVSVIALAEVLIAVSLCMLFYDSRSFSTSPRMKRLLNTLIIYAVNRCLLTSWTSRYCTGRRGCQ